MKWGRVIKENTVCEWKTQYISYDILKRMIRILSDDDNIHNNDHSNAAKLKSQFSCIVQSDLSKVEIFFIEQQQTLREEYDILMDKTDCIFSAFRKLLVQLKILQNYALINAEGFRKIIKKYDKRLSVNTKSRYYPLFEQRDFYKHTYLNNMIAQITDIINDENKDQENQLLDYKKNDHISSMSTIDKIKCYLLDLTHLPNDIGIKTLQLILCNIDNKIETIHLRVEEKAAVICVENEKSCIRLIEFVKRYGWRAKIVSYSQYIEYDDDGVIWQYKESKYWKNYGIVMGQTIDSLKNKSEITLKMDEKLLFIEKYSECQGLQTNVRTKNSRMIRRITLNVWKAKGKYVKH